MAVGCDRLLLLEAQGDPAWAMFDYWLRIEAEYRVVHSCFTLEAANIKYGKPPHFKSIGEVIRLLAV